MKYMSHPEDGLSVYVGMDYFHVRKDHKHWENLLDCIRTNNEAEFLNLVVDTTVTNLAANGITVDESNVYYNGVVVHNTICDRILEAAQLNLPIEPFTKFLENLMQNPSHQSVQELYGFLEHEHLPITEDGCFLAYKSVTHDYLDKHTETVSNKIGEKPSMPRNMVDDNRNSHCSKGYHVGAIEYAGPNGYFHRHGDHVMIVKVNPRDAVSVPTDHSMQKLRVCAYEVVDEYTGPMVSPLYQNNQAVPYTSPCDHDNEILPEQLKYGDEVQFEYKGVDRYGIVSEVDTTTVLLDESEADDSYDYDDEYYEDDYEPVYKRYLKSKIRHLRLNC